MRHTLVRKGMIFFFTEIMWFLHAHRSLQMLQKNFRSANEKGVDTCHSKALKQALNSTDLSFLLLHTSDNWQGEGTSIRLQRTEISKKINNADELQKPGASNPGAAPSRDFPVVLHRQTNAYKAWSPKHTQLIGSAEKCSFSADLQAV